MSLTPIGDGPTGDEDDDFDLDAALTTDDPERLWELVMHEDPSIRTVAAANPNLTIAQLAELLKQSQPTSVRVSAAQGNPTAAAPVAISDPNPFVRVWVLAAQPASAAERARYALDDDAPVASVRRLMDGLLPVGRYARRAS